MTNPIDRMEEVSEDEIKRIMSLPDNPNRVYFELDDQTVGALDLALEHLRRVPAESRSWKWVLLGIHAALHGSFSLVLERTDGYQLYGRKVEKRLQDSLWNLRNSPLGQESMDEWVAIMQEDPKLDEFMDLFAKACNPQRMVYLASVPLKPTKAQKASIELLNAHRGSLVHFSRTMLALDTEEMTSIVADSLDILNTLLTRTQYMSPEVSGGPIRTISDSDLADEADKLLQGLRSELLAARQRCEELGKASDASR